MKYHNFRELVEAKAKTDKVFMIQPEDGSSITYGKLKEEIEIFSKLLLEQGLSETGYQPEYASSGSCIREEP